MLLIRIDEQVYATWYSYLQASDDKSKVDRLSYSGGASDYYWLSSPAKRMNGKTLIGNGVSSDNGSWFTGGARPALFH